MLANVAAPRVGSLGRPQRGLERKDYASERQEYIEGNCHPVKGRRVLTGMSDAPCILCYPSPNGLAREPTQPDGCDKQNERQYVLSSSEHVTHSYWKPSLYHPITINL
jgi:hypothetical protein